jgi:hypothetical protein
MTDLHKNCPLELTHLRRKYNDDRFQQLNGLLGSSTSSVWTYLLTVNGGGAAGLLAFIGTQPALAKLGWPYCILFIFAAGIVFVGFAHAFIVHKLQALIDNWVRTSGKYWRNEVRWGVVLKADDALVNKYKWLPWALGWLSLLTFLIGVGWAAFEFRALATLL